VEHLRPRGSERVIAVTPTVFSADPAHVQWFGSRLLNIVAGIPPARVLDIGCGDGSLILYLAQGLPHASFVGVDLSEANIARAAAAVAQSPHRHRISMVTDDYLNLGAGRFDLIVASSSLQGMEATSEALAAKLARDAAAGGRLIHVTPYRCLYNSTLNVVRKGLRQARGTTTDRMILAVARALHPGQPHARLHERIDYMYLVLRHYEDGLRAALTRHGFHLAGTEPAPHTSLGQPKHRLAVMSAPPAIDAAQ
jgi:SAM-dependent methyltransferase